MPEEPPSCRQLQRSARTHAGPRPDGTSVAATDAGDGTRTRMAQRPPDFKSGASDQFRHPGAPSVAPLWQAPPLTHDGIVALAVLGVIVQVLAAVLILAALAAAAGVRGLLRSIRQLLWGYEVWA